MVPLSNPYRQIAPNCFWRKGVAGLDHAEIDPVYSVPFKINPTDSIATAGSCFAQHIARTLQAKGYAYLVTETSPETGEAIDENYGTFSARFGNIYSVRQLLQLIQRAYGVYRPPAPVWQDAQGNFIDPFRPAIQAGGFSTLEGLEADRRTHLAAVRKMLEACDVFVFTLGLTEGWMCAQTGTVFPLAPGTVAATSSEANYEFHNFSVAEMTADLNRAIDLLRTVNPSVRIILTVSPVPLVATYENRHVLVSNTYSKSALRVVAEEVSRMQKAIAYFPSFEIIMSPNAAFRYFGEDLREVLPEGVNNVMRLFSKHFLSSDSSPANPAATLNRKVSESSIREESARLSALQKVICDEELLDSNN